MKDNKQSELEIFKSLIHTLEPGMPFKSYRHFCKHFGITHTGGGTKKTIIAELTKYCEWKKKGNSIIIVSIKPDDLQPQEIDKKYLRSAFYPTCGYLLLVFLAEKCSNCEEKKYYCITKRRLMETMFICNSSYSEYSSELIDKISSRNPESSAFIKEAGTYLAKITDRTIDWLKERGLINYEEVYMVVIKDNKLHKNKPREATIEETNNINDYYKVIKDKYDLDKRTIRISPRKDEIDKEIKENLGYAHYTAIKFYLTDELENNADYLKRSANLTTNCGNEVNKLICDNIYNLVLKFIYKIREYENMTFEEFIEDFVKKGAPITNKNGKNAFTKTWNFNLDNNVVESTVEGLVESYIRIG
ncbi:MAG: hypothetical protein ACXVNF_01320 [Neobacillus sp.]